MVEVRGIPSNRNPPVGLVGGNRQTTMVDAAGIEPATPAMSTQCSTTELRVRFSVRPAAKIVASYNDLPTEALT